jgi:hypothetical protein
VFVFEIASGRALAMTLFYFYTEEFGRWQDGFSALLSAKLLLVILRF